MTPWLSIVGVGDDGLDGLAPPARTLVDGAAEFIGGARHIAMLPDDGRPRMTWPSPLTAIVDEIVARRGRNLCVLASGDPMSYGVGVTLARRIPVGEMTIVPAPSAFSLAAARLGWPLAEVETLTLHGRPLELLQSFVQPGAKLLVLSENGSTPARVADLLVQRGYGDSPIRVLEHMGGTAENIFSARASDWPAGEAADLNTVAVECVAGPDAALLPRTPGLPDDSFRHDGQLTKREVRAATLAALGPVPGGTLWDLGAGCGSVGIEWMRAARDARTFAVERQPERCAMIADNALALGTPQIKIVEGAIASAMADLPRPDAIFIGGGISDPELGSRCWEILPSGGRLVANVVTVEGEASLASLCTRFGGDLVRIAVSRAGPVGPYLGWRPLMTVTQWQAVKR